MFEGLEFYGFDEFRMVHWDLHLILCRFRLPSDEGVAPEQRVY